jgi:hypothetical protein
MKTTGRIYITVLVWFAAGVLLIYDGLADALASTTYFALLVNVAEAVIGVALLVVLDFWIQNPRIIVHVLAERKRKQ